MNKLQYALCAALLTLANNCFTAEEQSKENWSLPKKMSATAAAYTATSGVLYGIGHQLHKISEAPKYTKVIDNPDFFNAINLFDYPKYYYNASIFKHYCSKMAQGCLTASSLISAPLRMAVTSMTAPIMGSYEYIRAAHYNNNPETEWRHKVHLPSLKRDILKGTARASGVALVGAAPVVAYHYAQKYSDTLNNQSNE